MKSKPLHLVLAVVFAAGCSTGSSTGRPDAGEDGNDDGVPLGPAGKNTSYGTAGTLQAKAPSTITAATTREPS